MKIKKDGWLHRLLEGETQKIELLVSLSPQKVIEKLCFWGKSQGGVSDVCSVRLENGQEIVTAVFSCWLLQNQNKEEQLYIFLEVWQELIFHSIIEKLKNVWKK